MPLKMATVFCVAWHRVLVVTAFGLLTKLLYVGPG